MKFRKSDGLFCAYCKHSSMVGKHSHDLTTPDDKKHFKQLSSLVDRSHDEVVKKKAVTTMNPFTGFVSEAVILAKNMIAWSL